MMGNANLAGLNSPVWFITGCSTGFGRDLARHVLASGYRTVVTARRPDDLKEFADPERALLLKLDVTVQADIDAAVKAAAKGGPPVAIPHFHAAVAAAHPSIIACASAAA